MSLVAILGIVVALATALAAVLLGRNLTRATVASATAVAGLLVALVSSGLGFVAYFMVTIVLLVIATIQVFGWMLVDVERDHLPPTDPGTWIARLLAFLLLGGGLVLLARALLAESGVVFGAGLETPIFWVDLQSIGARVFGPWRDLATLCGQAIAAALLGSLVLVRGDREGER